MKRYVKTSEPFPRKLTESLWILGNYYFNLFLIKGTRGTVLIEMGISAIVDLVIEQLESINAAPDFLLITHPHADHITGLNGLRERFPSAEVIAAVGAEAFVNHPIGYKAMLLEDAFMSEMCEKKGIQPGRSPIADLHFPDTYISIEKEKSFDLGGITIHCERVGGHSPGNLIVRVPKINALIASDSLGFHFPGRRFFPLFFTGYQDYIETLEYILSLNPSILGLGHQSPIMGDDVAEAINAAKQAAIQFRATIATDERQAVEIAEEILEGNYVDEFTLYSKRNISGCNQLLVKRIRESLSE